MSAAKSRDDHDASTEKPNRLWPYAFLTLVALTCVLYTFVRARAIARAVVSHRITHGWYLRSGAAPRRGREPEAGRVRSARRTPRLEARLRGWYNAYLLRTVPVVDLTAGQCLVLGVYLACTILAVFVQAGDQHKNSKRSGRIA